MPALSTTRRALASGAVVVAAGVVMAAILYVVGSQPLKPGSMAAQVDEARPYWTASQYQCSPAATGPQNCTFGSSRAAAAILLTGDSHAAMIRSGLIDLSKGSGEFRLISRTLSSCRPVLRSTPNSDPCQRQNQAIAAEAPYLVRGGLKGVVLGAFWGSPGFTHMDDLAAQVRAWRHLGVRVALVAESPIYAHSPRNCLLHRPPSYCSLTRSQFEKQRASVMAQLRQATGGDPDVQIFDLSAPYCDAIACHVIRDGQLYFYDSHHLSLGGGQALAPAMKEMTDWLLAKTS